MEEGIDATTGLPGAFSRRRVGAIAAANRDVPAAAIAPLVGALALLEYDDKRSAAGALTQAVYVAPRIPNWLMSLGVLQEKAGQPAAAVATYEDVLNLHPANVVALHNLAYALAVHLNKAAEALPPAERAESLAPRVGTIIDTLAWIEHLLGNHDAASKVLAEAIRLEPKLPEVRLHAAIVFAALNLVDQSQAQLKEALRLDPAPETRDEVQRLRRTSTPKSPCPQTHITEASAASVALRPPTRRRLLNSCADAALAQMRRMATTPSSLANRTPQGRRQIPNLCESRVNSSGRLLV